VKDFMNNLWNSAFPGVTAVYHFIFMQRTNNIRVINAQKSRIIHHKNTKKKLFITHQYGLKKCKLSTPVKKRFTILSLTTTHISTVLALYERQQSIQTNNEEGSH